MTPYVRTNEIRAKIAAALTKPVEQRFWSKVDKDNGPVHPEHGRCWVWTAALFSNGYGVFGVAHKNKRSHRVSWELINGSIPSDMRVLHKCDNPRCVRPEHLFLGTDRDNAADRCSKGRQARGQRIGRAILNDELVAKIKQLLRDGLGGTDIQELLGVDRENVYNIKRGMCWRHVA